MLPSTCCHGEYAAVGVAVPLHAQLTLNVQPRQTALGKLTLHAQLTLNVQLSCAACPYYVRYHAAV